MGGCFVRRKFLMEGFAHRTAANSR